MKKHWSLKYAVAKITDGYWRKREKGNVPWLTYDSVQFLKQYLSREDIILETGSGSSTIWFSKLAKKIVSIEHNPVWHHLICERINAGNVKNIEYHLKSEKYLKDPADSDYVKKVASFPDNYFDIILIDGKHRSSIALFALEKIKKTGTIIIDNVERYLYVEAKLPEGIKSTSQMSAEWKLFNAKTAAYRKVVFEDGITSTMVIFINS